MMRLLIGADPELFVRSNGSIISAHGLIKGDKSNPFPVLDGAVQVDGMALEFNINPAENEKVFIHNINSVMAQLASMVPEYEIVAQPTAKFTEEYMLAQPKEALELGCDPDFNAWKDGEVNPKPDNKRPMRTGAGHIHIGWTEGADFQSAEHLVGCLEIVKQLDLYLGTGSKLFDKDQERRTMYGAPGAFRPKSYGVEYRVLSNQWLKSEALMSWVFNTTVKAVNDLIEGKHVPHRNPEAYGIDNLEEFLSSTDEESAISLLNKLGVEVPHV